MTKQELRKCFVKEMKTSWMDSKGNPCKDYVNWLEVRIMKANTVEYRDCELCGGSWPVKAIGRNGWCFDCRQDKM